MSSFSTAWVLLKDQQYQCDIFSPRYCVLSLDRVHENNLNYISIYIYVISPNLHFLQLTVATQMLPRMDLWRATLTQHMVQRCSTVVTQVWFRKGG